MDKELSLERQASLLTRWFPNASLRRGCIDGQRHLWFELTLQPTPTNAAYRVQFMYALRCRPLVYVVDPPPVRLAHGQRTPHLNPDGTLCLYDPAKRQWSGSDPLIYTIVQWASRWLYHYEHWLTFGEWRGDHEPVLAQRDSGSRVASPEAGA
jgi:hypothetical protein